MGVSGIFFGIRGGKAVIGQWRDILIWLWGKGDAGGNLHTWRRALCGFSFGLICVNWKQITEALRLPKKK